MDANLQRRVLLVPDSKKGESRQTPLSSAAVEVLQSLPRNILGRVWGAIHEASVSRAFARACKRAGIEDLRFHDLRHEATSRLFEKRLESDAGSGHHRPQDIAMLKRYTHLSAEDLAKRLG